MSLEIEVVVEIPRGSRNKYEADHETGVIWLDRTLFTATQYPADYGYLPETLAEDGDPLDALVLVEPVVELAVQQQQIHAGVQHLLQLVGVVGAEDLHVPPSFADDHS